MLINHFISDQFCLSQRVELPPKNFTLEYVTYFRRMNLPKDVSSFNVLPMNGTLGKSLKESLMHLSKYFMSFKSFIVARRLSPWKILFSSSATLSWKKEKISSISCRPTHPKILTNMNFFFSHLGRRKFSKMFAGSIKISIALHIAYPLNSRRWHYRN